MSDAGTRRVVCNTCGDSWPEDCTSGGECFECALLDKDCRAVVRQLSRIVEMLVQIADRMEERDR